MSDDSQTSWIEVEAAADLVPEDRRAEFLEELVPASWVPVQGSHPFSQGFAVRTGLERIRNAREQTWRVSMPEKRHHTVVGFRTPKQELFFLDDGDMRMQCVLIRPVTGAG
ncbi:hypothetical protein ACWF9B_00655 [Streptomyces sp. NPDC055089]